MNRRFARSPFALAAAALFASLLACGAAASAQSYTALYTYPEDSRNDTGVLPPAVMVQAPDGNLYGTILDNGPTAAGSAYQMTTGGTYTQMYAFCQLAQCLDGSHPAGGLQLGVDGRLYGTTENGGKYNGGSGTIFALTTTGTFKHLYDFTSGTDGGYPVYPPFQAPNGKLYGAGSEVYGGDYGLDYELSLHSRPPDKLTVIEDFNLTNGSLPNMPLLAGDGKLYGTTSGGGDPTCRCGVVYVLTARHKLHVLHIFKGGASDGNQPVGALAVGTDGNFYGTTYAGGTYNEGTIFRITPRGKFTLLHSFAYGQGAASDGRNPRSGLVTGSDGNFYGAIVGGQNGYGLLYRVTSSGALTQLYSMCPPPTGGCPTGFNPLTALVQHTNGKFYGNTSGNSYGGSVFYQLDAGLAPFIKVNAAAGRAGELVTILGQGFRDARSVRFGGVPARFAVGSDTSLTAEVPRGASTSTVTVTTGARTLASDRTFAVVP